MKFTILFSAMFLFIAQNVSAQELQECSDDQIDAIIDQFGCFPGSDIDDGDGDGEEGDSSFYDGVYTFLAESCGCDGETEPDPDYKSKCKKLLAKNSKTKKSNLPTVLAGLESMELISHEEAGDLKSLSKLCPK